MKQIIVDSYTKHNKRKLILFANEENIAVRKLYESIGLKEIGRYGIIFAE